MYCQRFYFDVNETKLGQVDQFVQQLYDVNLWGHFVINDSLYLMQLKPVNSFKNFRQVKL